MPRRILVLTYNYPPSTSVGAVRWSLMAEHLRLLGHEVTVVTTSAYGGGEANDTGGVIRIGGLEGAKRLRRMLGRPARKESGGVTAVVSRRRLVVPDAWLLGWTPFAYRVTRRLVRELAIDCVITSSPPESTHVAGLALRRLGPAWLADFRDGWIFEPGRQPFGNPLQAKLDSMLERAVVRRADVVVAVTEEYAADFRARLGADTVCVPNGWDPAMATRGGRRDDRTATLVFTGRLGLDGARRHYENMFARAVERFRTESAEFADRLDIVVAGPTSLPGARHLGLLPRDEALALQRSAGVLLLMGAGAPVAPAKLYEYLATGRPILHVGGPGAAARIIDETSSGITVGSEDAVVERLRQIARGEFGRDLESRDLGRYTYPLLAAQMAEAIERAIRHRG